ncbi:MAG: phosphoribosylaminoimidazolesuccinocarboxamide synthase [Candidatus Absconditicoccaceae bacterium]
MKQKPILGTDFQISGLKKIHTGKVRDVYAYEHKGEIYLFMVVTDRISAFDVVLPRGIPFKGQVLNQIASRFLDLADEEGISTWKINEIHPMVTVGIKTEPIMVEMIVRGRLTGSLWRLYKEGVREVCGITLPDGMKEWDEFPDGPIVTPTTKAVSGHDENISPEEIVKQGLATKRQYDFMDVLATSLFDMGTGFSMEKGLILVDTKYEFGIYKDAIFLNDEIHTPDSSRYLYEEGFEENVKAGKAPKSLDKEFVRQWLLSQGFKGDPGQIMPELTDEFIAQVSDRYLELYEKIMGEKLQQVEYDLEGIEAAIKLFVEGLEEVEQPPID